jgi:hypothetical protein
MASHTLTLYKGSCSTYNLDGISACIDLVPESSFMREEVMAILVAPLTIMPPPSYTMSGGSSLNTMEHSKEKKMTPTLPTTGAIGLKRKAPNISGPCKRSVVTPSGNTVSRASSSFHTARPSLSYTMVGVRKPKGGYGKVLMRKPTKKSENKPAPSGKETESTGVALRIKRMIKPQIRGQPTIFLSDSEDEQTSKGPMLASLSASNKSLRESVRKANDCLAESLLKIKDLGDEINELHCSFGEKVARVVKAVGVEHVLN